jgi:hypothetical protein
VVDQPWHAKCLMCAACRQPLRHEASSIHAKTTDCIRIRESDQRRKRRIVWLSLLQGIVQLILRGAQTRLIQSLVINWRSTGFLHLILKRHHHTKRKK